MPRLPANQKAFTLIEVLMAAMVLVVSFSAIIQAVTMGADMIDTAQKQQIAGQIIQGEISNLRHGPWSAITNFTDGAEYSIAVNGSGSFVTGDTTKFILGNNANLLLQAKSFNCHAVSTYILPPPPDPTTVNFLSITYAVTWNGFSGRTHRRTMVAFFVKNGLHLSYQK